MSPIAENDTTVFSPPRTFMCRDKLFNLKGLGTMNSVFGWVQRYKDEMECFHVKAKDKIEIVSPINVMRFQ